MLNLNSVHTYSLHITILHQAKPGRVGPYCTGLNLFNSIPFHFVQYSEIQFSTELYRNTMNCSVLYGIALYSGFTGLSNNIRLHSITVYVLSTSSHTTVYMYNPDVDILIILLITKKYLLSYLINSFGILYFGFE